MYHLQCSIAELELSRIEISLNRLNLCKLDQIINAVDPDDSSVNDSESTSNRSVANSETQHFQDLITVELCVKGALCLKRGESEMMS